MRLHRNLCFAVIDGLLLIFNEGEYADKVIQKLLKRDKRWGSRDRGFVAETTMILYDGNDYTPRLLKSKNHLAETMLGDYLPYGLL